MTTNYKLIASVGKEMAVANRIVAAFQLTLIVAFAIWLAAGDSTINNLSSADVLIDGTVLASSSIYKVVISEGSVHVDITYTRTITSVEIRNKQQYLIVQSQSGNTSMLNGFPVTPLDLVQAVHVETGF